MGGFKEIGGLELSGSPVASLQALTLSHGINNADYKSI
jgi:hypothetical protein